MMEREGNFIGSLRWLVDPKNHLAPDRGALAALRSGLGKRPGEAPRMFPYVARFLGKVEGASVEAMFLTASLFASHPEDAHEVRGVPLYSLGHSLWWATKSERNPEGKHLLDGVEARLAAALDADPEDLPRHLSGLVSLCESAKVPINWDRFMKHSRVLLNHPDADEELAKHRDQIRMEWARDFWRGPKLSPENQENPE